MLEGEIPFRQALTTKVKRPAKTIHGHYPTKTSTKIGYAILFVIFLGIVIVVAASLSKC